MKQKQTHRYREQACGHQGGGERDGVGVWGQQTQTITFRMDKQQGPTVEHTGNYIPSPLINRNGKEYKKECIYVYK